MPGISESRRLVRTGWDDVPHRDEKARRELTASIWPHQAGQQGNWHTVTGRRQSWTLPVPASRRGGCHILEVELTECSVVTLPMHERARVTGIEA